MSLVIIGLILLSQQILLDVSAVTCGIAGEAGECSCNTQSALGAKQNDVGLGGLIFSAIIGMGAKDQFAPAQFAIKNNAGKL